MEKIRMITMNELPIGAKATVKRIEAAPGLYRRLLDLGLILETQVQALMKSPSGDPVAYGIRGAVIAIRSEDSSKVYVMPV